MQRPVLAAFDFDGTLTTGGSTWPFLAAMSGRRRLILAAARLWPRILYGTLVGGSAVDSAKEALFTMVLAGIPEADLRVRAAEFGREHYRRRARPDTRSRLDWHLAAGHTVVIVSASPECYVTPVAQDLGASGVIATRLQVDESGLLTGKLAGANCRGPEKAARLAEWWAASAGSGGGDAGGEHDKAGGGDAGGEHDQAGGGDAGGGGRHEKPFVWAYGNSAGDRELLRSADVGVDAGRLGRLGKLRSFRRLASFADDMANSAGDVASRS